MEKTKTKIAEFQSRFKELERQKTELENADIIAMVRSIGEFVRLFKEQQKNTAVPNMDYSNNKEDLTE